MNKPTRKQLDAIVKLQNEEAFGVFMGWVAESSMTLMLMSLNESKEPERSWLQGKAKELRMMLEATKTARTDLEAVERNKEE